MKLRHLFLAGSVAATFLFAGCDKEDDDNVDNAVNAQDSTFLVQASLSNRAEIDLGALAATNATDSSVKAYAQMMVAEHTTAQAELVIVKTNITTNASLDTPLPEAVTALHDSLE